jgi:hypothetical protein
LDAVVEKGEEIIWDYAFERLAVEEPQAEPQAVEFRAAQEGAAFGFEVVIEIADKIDGADTVERKLFVLTVLSEQVDRIELAETRGIEVAPERLAVVELDDHLFVGTG